MKLSKKLDRLKRASPNRSALGQLYKNEVETRRRYKRVTLWTLFLSEENTHLLRNHEFKQDVYKSVAEWHEFFATKLTDIHRKSVLPGLHIRTQKSWSVERILGWVGNALYSAAPAKMGKRRRKTKRSRRAHG